MKRIEMIDALKKHPGYQTSVQSMGRGKWSIKITDRNGDFLFKLMGSHGQGDSDDVLDKLESLLEEAGGHHV